MPKQNYKKILKAKELKAVEGFKKQVTDKFGGQVLDMKLYGSKARGDSRRYSDIDIFILLKNSNDKKRGLIYDFAYDELMKYRVDISPRIFSKKEYDYEAGLPSIFMQTMSRDAIDL